MSFLFFRHLARPLCSKAVLSRYINRIARDGRIYTRAVGTNSFEAVGIRPTVAESLRTAFPTVEKPTGMQRKLLRAITQRRDILLQDDTGTGKSFAIMLALLSRLPVQEGSPIARQDGKTLTSLLIVPHRDLAYQYLHWMHHMTLSKVDTLAKYAQVLIQHVDKSTLRGLPTRMQEAIKSASTDQDPLIHETPHILITTPNALLELIEQRPEVCQALTPSVVFVDEVDALLRVPDGKPPKDRGRIPREKLGRHIPDLVRILDWMFPTSGDKCRMHQRVYPEKGGLLEQGHAPPAYRPQLVVVSATLRSKLRSALFSTYGWIQRGDAIKLIRKRSSALPAHRLGRSAVHHVLVVSETGDVKNIVGARPLSPDTTSDLLGKEAERKDEGDALVYDDNDDYELAGDVDKALIHAPLAVDPAILEAVAATFALDVPRVALLVLPATAAVRKIIFELQQLGVNAHPLDLVANEASRAHVVSRMGELSEENPVLIVGTFATIRGIDIPDLSHVFMLGFPGGRSGDVYLHVAGRVGRFGRRGKVVTILEGPREERAGNKVVAVMDEPKKMGILFSRIGIHPTRLEHFE